MSLYNELHYHFTIAKELFTIKSRFENEMDEEEYYYQTQINDYINFTDDGDFSFAKQRITPWAFYLEPNKNSMALSLEYGFIHQNERLTDVYTRFLVEAGLFPENSKIMPLEWTEIDDIAITDGANNLTLLLSGELDNDAFLEHFKCPTPVNPEYQVILNILSDMDTDELLPIYLEARIGNDSLDSIPFNIILAFEQLEEWIQANQ